jgi:hypothetical protein
MGRDVVRGRQRHHLATPRDDGEEPGEERRRNPDRRADSIAWLEPGRELLITLRGFELEAEFAFPLHGATFERPHHEPDRVQRRTIFAIVVEPPWPWQSVET